ncbi:MAG: hypothetical protein HYX92_18695 [Chloroflexi bacterium]|nr:hypothetical protein [Chloroflexota bacterium]
MATYKKRTKATTKVAEQAVVYETGTGEARTMGHVQGSPKGAESCEWSPITTSQKGYVVLSRTETTTDQAYRTENREALSPDTEREREEAHERSLHYLRTAPHRRAKRSPETIARMLAIIGAAGPGLPPDLSENLDDYLYGSKK